MKTLILSIAIFFTLLSSAQEPTTITIEVTVDNVTNNEGKVLFSLHSSETFMRGPGIKDAESLITDGKAMVIFEDVVPGTYAIVALHDQNENQRMDFDANGRPLENYGSSNNPMSMGPPQFGESKFEVEKENLKMAIRF